MSFKLGDRVRIIETQLSVFPEARGRIFTIIKFYPDERVDIYPRIRPSFNVPLLNRYLELVPAYKTKLGKILYK